VNRIKAVQVVGRNILRMLAKSWTRGQERGHLQSRVGMVPAGAVLYELAVRARLGNNRHVFKSCGEAWKGENRVFDGARGSSRCSRLSTHCRSAFSEAQSGSAGAHDEAGDALERGG
jgi:hypothetical protein